MTAAPGDTARDLETAAALTLAARDFRITEEAYRKQALQRQANRSGSDDDKLRTDLYQGGYIGGERNPTL